MTKKSKKNSKDYIWLMSTLFSDSVYSFVKGKYDLTEDEYKNYRDNGSFLVDIRESKHYTVHVLYVDKYATIKHNDSKKPKTKRKNSKTKKA